MGISQTTFARRLRELVDSVWAGWKKKDIAQRAGVNAVTLSRWRDPSYMSGPPSQKDLGELEPALGLGKGTLLADAKTWRVAIKQLKMRRDRGDPSQPSAHTDFGPASVEPTAGPLEDGGPEDWLSFALRFARMLRDREVELDLDVRLALINVAERIWNKQGVEMADYFDALREEQRRRAS